MANNIPCQGEWRGSFQPCLMMAGRKGNSSLGVRLNDTNFNTIVVGTSGSGKSVGMQGVDDEPFGMGARVVVFDLGRSFENLAIWLGVLYIRFEKNADMYINPLFFLWKGSGENDANERRDQLEAIAMTMEQMAIGRGIFRY